MEFGRVLPFQTPLSGGKFRGHLPCPLISPHLPSPWGLRWPPCPPLPSPFSPLTLGFLLRISLMSRTESSANPSALSISSASSNTWESVGGVDCHT